MEGKEKEEGRTRKRERKAPRGLEEAWRKSGGCGRREDEVGGVEE